MYNNTKILLTILVEGGRLVRQSEKTAITFVIRKQDLSKNKLPKEIGSQIVKTGKRFFYTHLAVPTQIKINLPKEAYYAAISKRNTPSGCRFSLFKWNQLTDVQKLNWYCADLMIYHGGFTFTYEILED